MSATDEIIEGVAEAFDELRAVFFPGSVSTLLKPGEAANEYDTVLELDGKWFFDTDKNILEIADRSESMKTAITEATHLRIDDKVYIADGERKEPKGAAVVVWSIECNVSLRKDKFRSPY